MFGTEGSKRRDRKGCSVWLQKIDKRKKQYGVLKKFGGS
jgi:hypothetical protein